uniref:Secreted protein n=1 Tax=Oryza rufipogon TaxID=4529 RepID=A0A0E0RDZ9_ORYRU
MVFLKIMLPFANLCAIPVLRKMARDGGRRRGVLRGASWKPPRRSLTSPSPTWARPSTSRFGAYHPESECWAAPLTTTPDGDDTTAATATKVTQRWRQQHASSHLGEERRCSNRLPKIFYAKRPPYPSTGAVPPK